LAQVLSAGDQARKEIRDMIDATLSVIMREHDVDESFVIKEIKDYLSKTDSTGPRNNGLKVIRYSPTQVLRSGGFGSVVNLIRSKVQKINGVRLVPWPPDSSN
tara:strand:+ start:44 stop:352 length:309 start_codon:yes stop_codon:yes gene_type:complete